jgi:phosphoglycolate phosphatase
VSAPPRHVEVLNPSVPRVPFPAAVFDFDGTVSLIREGWSGVMADLGVELFEEQGITIESPMSMRHFLEDQMLRLSGKPSIFQMQKLGELLNVAGGKAPDSQTLLAEFLKRLFVIADLRKSDLAAGNVTRDVWAVPGTHRLLDELRRRGVALYLASGTDLDFVRSEAALLGLTDYFGKHIYAPAKNTPHFTKRDVMTMILTEHDMSGKQLVGFGDGYAETVEIKRVGGVAVGLASQEAGIPGVHPLKRTMLIELGADIIIPDYAEPERLVSWLMGDEVNS